MLLVIVAVCSNLTNAQAPIFCTKDQDCNSANCVLFMCKPPSCRSDDDCKLWGHENNFCKYFLSIFKSWFINFRQKFLGEYSRLSFVGTQCKPKKASGGFCLGNNECASGICALVVCL